MMMRKGWASSEEEGETMYWSRRLTKEEQDPKGDDVDIDVSQLPVRSIPTWNEVYGAIVVRFN